MFVLVACPENSLLDWKEFYQPVVSLYEVELACNSSRQWSSKYVTDFRQLLCGKKNQYRRNTVTKLFLYHQMLIVFLIFALGGLDFVEAPDTSDADTEDVSLITGKVRRIDVSSNLEDTQDEAVATRANLSVCLSTGSEYLANRSWRGLEQNLGETPVDFAVKGRSGIASSYLSEPMQKD